MRSSLKHFFTILLSMTSLFVSSCGIDNLKEMYSVGYFNKYTYTIGENLDIGENFKVYDKENNFEIENYDIYLNDVLVDESYIFENIGTYDISIKASGYEEYLISDNHIIVKEEDKYLTLDTTNTKTNYYVGESFSTDGLIVKDNLNNIIEDFEVSLEEGYKFNNSIYSLEIKISKDGYIGTSYFIHVEDIGELNLDLTNARTIFTKGEEFSSNGLIVKDNKNNNSITDFNISIPEGFILNETGNFNVVISRVGYEDISYGIKVVNEKVMILEEKPLKLEYFLGETIDLNGLKLIDSLTKEEINDYGVYIGDNLISDGTILNFGTGNLIISIKKSGYFDNITFTINVKPNGVVIKNLPNKTAYLIGETFNSDGLIITDGVNVLNEYELSIEEGHIFTHTGKIEIDVTSDGLKKNSFEITVLNQKGMMIKNKPQIYFEVGDKFNSDGLYLVDNNTMDEITNYTLSINEGEVLNSIGTYNVSIKSDGYPDLSYEIEVNKKLNNGDFREFNIYTINDTHGSFLRNSDNYEAGMAYIGDYLIDRKNEDSLILSAGDMWQGGLESNDTKGVIMSEAMNLIGFDAMTIGNHEFDWDIEAIKENLKVMEFPLLGNNIFYKNTNENVEFTLPYTVINRSNLKVGIIGSIMEGIGSSILASISNKFDFVNPIPYVKEQSDYLRNELGCDIVIFLSHDGGFEGYNGVPSKYYELTTISDISNKKYVDAMVFAHDHLRKEGIYNDVPFIEAGENGEYIGNIEFNVIRKSFEEYEIDIDTIETNVINAFNNCKTENEEIANLVNKYSDVITDSNDVIYTFKNDYSESEFTVIVCQALLWFMNEYKYDFGNHDIYIGIHNTAGIRGNVYKGDFTYGDLIKVCPFSNAIALLTLSPNQINFYRGNNALRYFINNDVSIDENGFYYGATISYVAEWTDRNGNLYCTNYELFPNYIISDVLIEYLKSGANNNL